MTNSKGDQNYSRSSRKRNWEGETASKNRKAANPYNTVVRLMAEGREQFL